MVKRFGPREHRRRKVVDPEWKTLVKDKNIDPERLRQEVLEIPLASLRLSVRTVNNLEEHGITRVSQLLEQSRVELLSFPNFGPAAIVECKSVLAELGLRDLGIKIPSWHKPRPKSKNRRSKKT